MKPSTTDLFGSDSNEDDNSGPSDPKKGKPLYSYITRRLANGNSRQIDENKTGSHYIELRVYSCDEIQSVQPINRWRYSFIIIKNKTNTNSEAWSRLTDFISITRKEYIARQLFPVIINRSPVN